MREVIGVELCGELCGELKTIFLSTYKALLFQFYCAM